jgi:late competence protein required for DNA uptake (superfamily II DNA/RNA helicase)
LDQKSLSSRWFENRSSLINEALMPQKKQILKGGLVSADQITDERLIDMRHLFDCQICLQVVHNPIECQNCGGIFCKDCIEMYQTKRPKECVLHCKMPVNLPANRTVKKLLNDLQFTCNNDFAGCKEIINYD